MGWTDNTPVMDENLGVPGNLRRRGLGGILASMGTGMPTPSAAQPRDPGMSGPAPDMDPNEGAAPHVPLRDPNDATNDAGPAADSETDDIPTYFNSADAANGRERDFQPAAISHTSPHLAELEAEWQRRTHPSTGNKILNLVGKLAPIAIGGIAGGMGGAGAAALGVNRGELENRKFAQNDKDMLIREMEGERNRVERGAETTERANEMGQYHNDMANFRRDSRAGAAPTADAVDPVSGQPMKMQWNPATRRYDIPVGGVVQKGQTRLPYKMLEDSRGLVVQDQRTGQSYDPKDPNVPQEVKDFAKPFVSAHDRKLQEEIDKETRSKNNQITIKNDMTPFQRESLDFREAGPTQQTRQMGQQAKLMLPHLDTIEKEIDALDKKGKLGPVAGRLEDFMIGKVGAGDPDYSKLRTNLSLWTSGMTRAHLGARGGAVFLDNFKKLWDAGKMDAASLKASLGESREWLQGYADGADFKPGAAGGSTSGGDADYEYKNGKLIPVVKGTK